VEALLFELLLESTTNAHRQLESVAKDDVATNDSQRPYDIGLRARQIILHHNPFVVVSLYNMYILREKRGIHVSDPSFALDLDERGITPTHLADEDPDQPKPSSEEGQGTIQNKLPESVVHNDSFGRYSIIIGDVITAT